MVADRPVKALISLQLFITDRSDAIFIFCFSMLPVSVRSSPFVGEDNIIFI